MATRPVYNPWPRETLSPEPDEGIRRKRSKRHIPFKTHVVPSATTSKNARQIVADQPAVSNAQTACQFTSGNDVISCFPTSDVVIPQHEWATFVWNSRLPTYQYTKLVNIYLFRADSRRQVLQVTNFTNPYPQAGVFTARVNDSWWGSDGGNWSGTNITYPFYWVIAPNDESIDGLPVPQTTFSAVQTTYADSVIASMSSSASASSASASSASAASASLASHLSSMSAASSASGTKPTTSPSSGSLQAGANSSSFPHWAIAVIVVLGFLAIVAICMLIFLILRRIRRRRKESDTISLGSASPMMAEIQEQAAAPQSSIGHQAVPASLIHDGASSISRPGSATEPGPFSPADALIMADAYRKVLRNPPFAERVEEDAEPEAREDIITRELAEEGRDIRSVGSSRGVRVETLSDTGDTFQDHSRLRE